MKISMLRLATFFGLTSAALSATATQIIYTDTLVGSGTLDGSSFTSAQVTISESGDTSTVFLSGFDYFAPGTSTVTVAGVGTDTFTNSTFTAFVNQGYVFNGVTGIGGFGDRAVGTTIGTSNSAFASYDLKSAFGPVSGGNFLRPDLSFATTAGSFNLSSGGTSTFTATLAPEPMPFVALGFGALALARRRRKA